MTVEVPIAARVVYIASKGAFVFPVYRNIEPLISASAPLCCRCCWRAQPEAIESSLRPHTNQVRHARHHGVRVLASDICTSTHPRDDTTGGQG